VIGIVVAIVLVALLGILAVRSLRAALVVLGLVPLLDRYVIGLLLPEELQSRAEMVPEVLLLLLSAVILVAAWRTGRLLPAFRHPVVGVALLFGGLAALSTVVNGVAPTRALLGIVFTVDALVLFVLPRALGFSERTASRAALALVTIATLAAVVAIGQVVLTPDLLGGVSFEGRFGEGTRPGAFFIGQPNMLGAVVGMVLPLTVLAALDRTGRRAVRIGGGVIAVLLALVLIYTFSRGTWLGVAVATIVTGLTLDRRILVAVPAAAVIALVIALIVPRGMLLSPEQRGQVDYLNGMFGRVGELAGGRDLRMKFVENALPIVVDHPLIGAGPGMYGGGVAASMGSPLYQAYTAGVVPTDRTVDNYWLHALVEFGVAGALLLATMLGLAILECIRGAQAAAGRRRVLLAGFAAMGIVLGTTSITEMLLEGNTTSFPLWLFLGIGTVLAGEIAAAATVVAPGEPDPVGQPEAA
jgi:O-antigen ligase